MDRRNGGVVRVKKTEIQRSYHGHGSSGRPMLKVKWYPYLPDIIRQYRGSKDHEYGDEPEFWEWVERVYDAPGDFGSKYPDGPFCVADEFAREDGWELAKEAAEEIFPGNVEVYSEGRSGGWLVVSGLPDVEEWNAAAVARWARFAKAVKAILDDRDYQFVWHLFVNVYEAERNWRFRYYEKLGRPA